MFYLACPALVSRYIHLPIRSKLTFLFRHVNLPLILFLDVILLFKFHITILPLSLEFFTYKSNDKATLIFD